MKKRLLAPIFILGATAMPVTAQEVNRKLYRDFTPVTDYVLSKSIVNANAPEAQEQRPDHVNNALTKYFPPVFNQSFGSCGSASNEGYNFTYEMNCFLDRDGSLPENQFPSHWIYLLAYQNSDREEILQRNGVPSVVDYGGRTYSETFGEQDCDYEDSGRMQGYDKWYRAMFNRAVKSFRFCDNLNTKEGQEDLKNWLWNHYGDPDFHAGGLACVGVASTNCKITAIPSTPTNRVNKVAGLQYISSWGPTYDHSVTIVGYDDRVQFDLNGNKKYGEAEEGELGAWIICNSWGTGWGDKGFVYLPYKYSYSILTNKEPMAPYSWILRKNYVPKRVFRIRMDYSRRAEIQLVAGVSENLKATKPDYTMVMPMFNFDGNPNKKSPAPEVPMLGRWKGKMNYDPMEFGFDVTDLTEKVDKAKPLKYFFQIKTASNAIGQGKVYEFSLMNYEDGIETIVGLSADQDPVAVKNNGGTVNITVTTQGTGTFCPESPAARNGVLSWKAPQASEHALLQYYIYANGHLTDSVPSTQLTYNIPEGVQEYLQVAAKYALADGSIVVSKRSELVSPVASMLTRIVQLSCDIDGSYLALLRNLTSKYRLTDIDMEKARIIDGGDAYDDVHFTANNEFGTQLFYECQNLKKVILPESTTVIGSQALAKTGITSIVIPDRVRSVGMDACAYCSALKSVTVGYNVTNMGQGIFYSSPVKDAYVKAPVPPAIKTYLFSSKPTIHVYSQCEDDYKASPWATFGTIVGDLENYIPMTDGIQQTNTDMQHASGTFDLSGRRLQDGAPTQKGIYIRNGKKYIQK